MSERTRRKTATAPAPSLITQLSDAFSGASEEEREQLKSLFPNMAVSNEKGIVDRSNLSLDEQLALARSANSRKQETTSAQMIVMTMGSVPHPNNWEPAPPEHVSEMGAQAEKLWLLRWHQGKAQGSMEQFRRELGGGNAQIGEDTVTELEVSSDVIGGMKDGESPVTEAPGWMSMENDSKAAAEAAGGAD